MKWWFLLPLLLNIIVSVLSSDVLEYTDANFEQEIQQHDIALAEFYAPW
jgi:hypothetical protein